MSANAATTPSSEAPRSQRSRLLAWNRKLRHLHGITLRNLNLGSSQNRWRRKTIDDEAVPSALKTPAKLLAASEGSKLTASRSFTDLKSQAASRPSEILDRSSAPSDTITTTPQTPKRQHTRRTSVLDWTNASPVQWQQILRDTLSKTTGDVFFSLHCPDIVDPIYISEVASNTSNPNFCFFDLNTAGADISRQDILIVNFWASKGQDSPWQHLVELFVNLRSMQYIGKSLEDYHQLFPENCVIFHLTDGLYTCLTDASSDEPARTAAPTIEENPSGITSPTSSYDALMRLSTLDQCIQEAIAAREKLTTEINNIISQDHNRLQASHTSAAARESLATVERAKESERRQIKALDSKRNELQANLQQRSAAIKSGNVWQESETSRSELRSTELDSLHASHHAISSTIRGQRRRICTDLSEIYPIEPIPNKSLQFTIRDLALPNSTFSKTDMSQNADTISAALGHVSHVVYLLSYYLSIPLPYPVTPYGSTSAIYDPISISLSQAPTTLHSAPHLNSGTSPTSNAPPQDPDRTFPLHMTKTSPFYRFEYGVFLLNKDIETLAAKLGLRILDIRQTLANLKYILFVATAGEGELPMRKAGGVRGLLHASGKSAALSDKYDSSASLSEDSSSTPSASIGIPINRKATNGSTATTTTTTSRASAVAGKGAGTNRSLADSLRKNFITSAMDSRTSSPVLAANGSASNWEE